MFVVQPSIDLDFLQLGLEFGKGFEGVVVLLDCFEDHHLARIVWKLVKVCHAYL